MPDKFMKFRGDLVVSPLEGHRETAFVVKDPIIKKFFRFKQHELFIARQLDGNTSFEEIQERFENEFGVSLPDDKLKRYLQLLQDLSFLETERSPRELERAFEAGVPVAEKFRIGLSAGVQIQPCLVDLSRYPKVATAFCPLNGHNNAHAY